MSPKVPALLEEGDVVWLKRGHTVYALVPEKHIYVNRPQSGKLARTNIEVASAPWAPPEGEYVVYKTSFDGGGTGMGPHDIFPDGHHVCCEKLDDPSVKVDFYQSGCFTAMIRDIAPVGKKTRKWA